MCTRGYLTRIRQCCIMPSWHVHDVALRCGPHVLKLLLNAGAKHDIHKRANNEGHGEIAILHVLLDLGPTPFFGFNHACKDKPQMALGRAIANEPRALQSDFQITMQSVLRYKAQNSNCWQVAIKERQIALKLRVWTRIQRMIVANCVSFTEFG